MATVVNGTANDDQLTIQADTTSVVAGKGTDTLTLDGN